MNQPMKRRARAAVVYNPVKTDAERLKRLVGYAADSHGWESVSWFETSVADPGGGQARQAVAEGAEMVVACGGDGTVRAVAAGLRDSGAALGIVPQGTGNLLARNLKLPLNQEYAIEVAFGGQDDEIDICTAELTRADGTTEQLDFVVMAGVGIDAQMIINTDDQMKKRFGFLAYAVAVIKSLRGGNRIKLLHRMDGGKEYRTSVHSVIVGNCGELIGNVALLPDAKANDGILDVVAMRPRGVFGWAQIALRLADQMVQKLRHKIMRRDVRVTGTDQDVKALQYVTGKQFSVELQAPELFEIDGDEVGEVTAFTVTVDHLGLTVRVETPAPQEEPGEAASDTDVLPGVGIERDE